MTVKISESLVEALNSGANALTNLVGITNTVIKREEEYGLDKYLNMEFERVLDVEEVVDEFGQSVLDEEGRPTYKDVELLSTAEQDRDRLKRLLSTMQVTSSKDLIKIFNEDTKSKVKSVEEMHDTLVEMKAKLFPVIQLGRVSESLEKLGASEETLEEISEIYNKEIKVLKKFFLME